MSTTTSGGWPCALIRVAQEVGPRPGDLRQPPTAAYEEVPALKFRRALEQPVREHPENALDAVLRLANSTDFQDARRALHTAEALAAAVAFAELARAI